ncbi:hypothetical protein GCK72_008892 [Caenorhabditis remanei]|uniref:Uncharacterized protein n=1 Tax=Caenorhabditis remanei TaxID=31234 RepID=E3N6P8_CAERE|nr:hypothetical protein GCK72_008892 [Caenorhabditis remanei]EFO88147.1 hypothetical protein CRE_06970 [Caenorhabditis remanei]KAF1760643.1 hypothetical protein GCK72_008892 [Caenorhabditis remanei]
MSSFVQVPEFATYQEYINEINKIFAQITNADDMSDDLSRQVIMLISLSQGAKQKAGNENKDKKEMDDIMAMIGSLQIKSTQNPK